MMTRTLIIFAAALVILPMASYANGLEFLAQNPADQILEIVKQVLDVIVQFIGDILDEFVRAIKELLNGDDTRNA